MQPWFIRTPTTPFYRIGRRPNPLEWAPWSKVGEGRFDDPRLKKTYRVLYAGDRRACFLEALADFRPDLQGNLAHPLTQNWIDSRMIARFLFRDRASSGRWLNIRAPETFQFFRRELASTLMEHDLADFDLSVATGEHLDITQKVSLWAHEEGCCGIVYPTRFSANLSCYAFFERFDGMDLVDISLDPLDPMDDDFTIVRRIYGLPLPSEAADH